MSKIEKGRTFNHRQGQLESDIFDRDTTIKELQATNALAHKHIQDMQVTNGDLTVRYDRLTLLAEGMAEGLRHCLTIHLEHEVVAGPRQALAAWEQREGR